LKGFDGHDSQAQRAVLAQRVSTLAIATTLALIAVTARWQLASAGWILAGLFTVPLWLGLMGLLRYRPGTRAWTTLCAVPYLPFGTMELIANPDARGWAAACVLLAFALFALLALLLRMRGSPHFS